MGSTVETKDDEFGYRWMIVRDPDIEDLAVGVNAVSDALAVGGYNDRVLAAVFAFEDADGKPLYLIYNYKRGTWYPFVPAAGRQAAQHRARAADQGGHRLRAALRARARALVPPVGDPHLSLRALVLADEPPYVPLGRLLERDVDLVLCLGDLVARGPRGAGRRAPAQARRPRQPRRGRRVRRRSASRTSTCAASRSAGCASAASRAATSTTRTGASPGRRRRPRSSCASSGTST